MKRDFNDEKWQAVKRIVGVRDNCKCRLCRVLNPTELALLRKNAGPFINAIDPAHFLSVGLDPDLCYNPENIVCLNRYSHSCLDDYKNPITGKHISKEEHREWWIRILKGNKKQWEYLIDHNMIEEN